jgi:hypothetical protein
MTPYCIASGTTQTGANPDGDRGDLDSDDPERCDPDWKRMRAAYDTKHKLP